MKYTNVRNFPQYIVDWLIQDDYDHNYKPNTFSATTLLKPVKIHWLTVRNEQDLQIDVADLAPSRIGSAVHDSIEHIESDHVIKEERNSKDIVIDGETYTVRGKFDILVINSDGSADLRDIKTTSVWAYIFGGKDLDYKIQLSVYRWLIHEKYSVNNTAYIDFFFTDWQSSKAKQDFKYPQHKIMSGYKIPLMSLDETEAFIVDKIKHFVKYRNVSDTMLPPCSKEDLWATDEKWAVYKPKATKATKLCDSMEEAQQYIQNKKINATVQHRPFKVKRCRYCSAMPFCKQGKSYYDSSRIQF